MKNLILEKIVTLFLYIMVGFAFFLLFRGHNRPGGGFIAGIIASAGFLLYGIVFGSEKVLEKLRTNPRYIIGSGLLISFIATILPMMFGNPPLTGMWFDVAGLYLGSPLLFDIGVFVLVFGVIVSIFTNIMDVLKWNS
ncbi:MnhB domain-containing protein [Marinilabilia rubra]|uniref:Cation:proton antiporter n=1 Tax=Marinilabilia rubra TaxID=2162893 RepID=A0A2U2BCL8_9BACT|nr:MnhB domain-containing protein [Marinilabilia rubra]PWE00773.1 cation:proton antiporter [Marinilabilia rubra]